MSAVAARALIVAEGMASAGSPASLLALLKEGAEALGAEIAVFVSLVRSKPTRTAVRLLTTRDAEWFRQYLETSYLGDDPWLAYAAHRSEPILASEFEPEDQAGRNGGLATHAAFASAILAPAHVGAGHGRTGLLCLGSSQPRHFERPQLSSIKIGARVLAAELHEWWLANERVELLNASRLTRIELDLLRQQHLGHTSKRIAATLNVSQSSINSRFQRMNMKLGVANRKAAVRLALECGLL